MSNHPKGAIDIKTTVDSLQAPSDVATLASQIFGAGQILFMREMQYLQALRAQELDRIRSTMDVGPINSWRIDVMMYSFDQTFYNPAVEMVKEKAFARADEQSVFVNSIVQRLADIQADAISRLHELDVNKPVRQKEGEIALGQARMESIIQGIKDTQDLDTKKRHALIEAELLKLQSKLRIVEMEAEGRIVNEREIARIAAEEKEAQGKRDEARMARIFKFTQDLPHIRANINLMQAEAPADIAKAAMSLFMSLSTNLSELQNAPPDVRPAMAERLLPMIERLSFMILEFELSRVK